MENGEWRADITQLAKMMRARRAAGVAPYTLLLGSSLSLTPAVRRAVCDSEDWEAFWETVSRTSPAERRALMLEPLSQLDLQAGCDALAQLVGAGYFNVVLTLNMDDALDDALKTLPASEYRVWVHGEVPSREIVTALDRPTPRIKVVKLHGDVNAYKLPLTPEATFEFPPDLEDSVTRYLRHDTVIVGDLPFDDDVHRCIRQGDGALWIIAAGESGFLKRVKGAREVGAVIAAAEFNAFLTALAEELGLGAAEQAAPEIPFVPPEERFNPYRGLEPFEPEHTRFFFGRELLTETLVKQLRQSHFLAVLGASGSGKSSVVRAGLLPALAEGQLPGSENWIVLLIKPGQNPQEALAEVLAGPVSTVRSAGAINYEHQQQTRWQIRELLLREESALYDLVAEIVAKDADNRRVVVVIDQFEELFTQCPFEQRQRFIDNLLYAVRQPEGHTTVLLTMRADFVIQLTAYPDLNDLVSSHQVWVRAMDDTGLRGAIERPLWLTGMQFEPGLVPVILADLGREPGALPLLQDALWSLFEHCCAGDEVIELREYREIGGVQGALAKRAEAVYETLTAEEQEYTRRILLRLTEMKKARQPTRQRATLDRILSRLVEQEETREATRRRATLNELITAPEERAPVEKVVQRLTDARLLTTTRDEVTGRQVIDISHEALIRGWPRLRGWLEESQEDLLIRHQLREAAAEWERGERHESYLYRGARLAKVVEWRAAHEIEQREFIEGLSELEQAFLDTSVMVEERERAAQERMRRRVMAGLGIGLVVALTLSIFAGFQWRATEKALDDSERQHRIALSRQLAAQSQAALEDYPQRSLLLAVEALHITTQEGEPRVPAAEDALRQALANSGGRGLGGHEGPVYAMAISPDNRWLVTGSGDATARLWDVSTLLNTGVSTLLNTGLTASDPTTAPIVLRGHEGDITAVAISPDNRWLVTASEDATARLWDISALLNTGATAPDPAAVSTVLSGHESWITAVAISSDSRWLVTGSGDATARLWDVSTLLNTGVSALLDTGLTEPDPAAVSIVLRGHSEGITAVAISPDNRWLVTASQDATVRLWDVSTLLNTGVSTLLNTGVSALLDAGLTASGPAAEPIVLRGHSEGITAMAISSDSRWLVTGSGDATARLWDVSALFDTGATDPDPATASTVLSGHSEGITAVAISPDSHWLVTGSLDETARLWDVSALLNTGVSALLDKGPAAEPIVLGGHEGAVYAVAISPDSHWVVTASEDATARLWDVWALLSPGPATSGPSPAAPAPSPAAEPVAVLRGHEGAIYAVAIGPDSRWLATGSYDATAHLWDVSTLLNTGVSALLNTGVSALLDKGPAASDLAAAPIALRGHEGDITAVAISPDSRWLATASEDATARLWDVSTLLNTGVSSLLDKGPAAAPIVLPGHEGSINAIAISPDNRWLVTGGEDATAHLWDVSALLSPGPAAPTPNPAAASIVLRGYDGAISAVAISPDSRWLVTASQDATARLWDVSTLLNTGATAPDPAAASTVLSGHESWITAVAISSDSRWLVTGSGDATARLWDVSTLLNTGVLALLDTGLTEPGPAAEPIVLHSHSGGITAVAISPDDRWLIAGSRDGTTRLWDVSALLNTGLTDPDPTAAPIVLRGHEGDITAVAISPDSHWLVTASEDATARLWDVSALLNTGVSALLDTGLTGTDLADEPIVLRGHEESIEAMAISPDSHWLVTGSQDGTARLWDVSTLLNTGLTASDPAEEPIVLRSQGWDRAMPPPPGHQHPPTLSSLRGQSWINAVAISPDNHWLVTSSGSTAHLWNLRLDELIDLACRTTGRNLTSAEWEQYWPGPEYRKTCPDLPIHPSFTEAGRALARAGDVEGAMVQFQRALELDPNLDLAPEAEAAQSLVEGGEALAKAGDVESAVDQYAEAQTLDPTLEISADSWKALCWFGSLWGYAAEVIDACGQAVQLAPDDGTVRDSRGLARALTEDYTGAIEDFTFFVEWSKENDRYEPYGAKREAWIAKLKAGRDPFDEETLEALWSE